MQFYEADAGCSPSNSCAHRLFCSDKGASHNSADSSHLKSHHRRMAAMHYDLRDQSSARVTTKSHDVVNSACNLPYDLPDGIGREQLPSVIYSVLTRIRTVICCMKKYQAVCAYLADCTAVNIHQKLKNEDECKISLGCYSVRKRQNTLNSIKLSREFNNKTSPPRNSKNKWRSYANRDRGVACPFGQLGNALRQYSLFDCLEKHI